MLAIERSLEVQSTSLCGEVTISATEGTGTEWLTPVLLDFHAHYPDIVLKVQIESRAVDLIRREADIALRLGQPAQPDLIARRLVTVGFGLYASESYLRRASPLKSVQDLHAHQMVGLLAFGTGGASTQLLPSTESLPGTFVYQTNSPTAQLSAVQAGFGIGILSHRWASIAGGLTRILPDYTAASIDLWLVTHEELRHSARIRAVFDFIAERALADAELFERGSASQQE